MECERHDATIPMTLMRRRRTHHHMRRLLFQGQQRQRQGNQPMSVDELKFKIRLLEREKSKSIRERMLTMQSYEDARLHKQEAAAQKVLITCHKARNCRQRASIKEGVIIDALLSTRKCGQSAIWHSSCRTIFRVERSFFRSDIDCLPLHNLKHASC